VDAAAVREFVLASLNQANSRDVDRFLEAEFDRGMAEGRWLFLFDSFDEIPDVLSADRIDETVQVYADALFNFLHGMNRSRGVIASREFRGPYGFGWPRFTVQRLTAAQQRELIERADLPRAAEQAVINGIAAAEPPVARLTENPMLLGLLCEHVRETGGFPGSSHTVFETFVASRLRRDAERVERRFGIGPDTLRAVAEEIAFHLTADESLGLSPARSQLGVALAAAGRGGTGLGRQLDALEYVKLASAPEGLASGGDRPFTFAHRRFQEYFATCVVIREPQRVSRDALLLDGRWRETAVTMLQTQPAVAVADLVADAEQRLLAGIATLPPDRPAGFFPWPAESRHLLALLDAGAANRPDLVPARLRERLGELLRRAWEQGRRVDRKWALEGAALADPPTTTRLIESVFATDQPAAAPGGLPPGRPAVRAAGAAGRPHPPDAGQPGIPGSDAARLADRRRPSPPACSAGPVASHRSRAAVGTHYRHPAHHANLHRDDGPARYQRSAVGCGADGNRRQCAFRTALSSTEPTLESVAFDRPWDRASRRPD
jgi:hypothetical protein